jgi:hypothetical protein
MKAFHEDVDVVEARAQLGQREAALATITRVSALDASKRLQMVDDPLLAAVR